MFSAGRTLSTGSVLAVGTTLPVWVVAALTLCRDISSLITLRSKSHSRTGGPRAIGAIRISPYIHMHIIGNTRAGRNPHCHNADPDAVCDCAKKAQQALAAYVIATRSEPVTAARPMSASFACTRGRPIRAVFNNGSRPRAASSLGIRFQAVRLTCRENT